MSYKPLKRNLLECGKKKQRGRENFSSKYVNVYLDQKNPDQIIMFNNTLKIYRNERLCSRHFNIFALFKN